jgi:peptide chain release factor 2
MEDPAFWQDPEASQKTIGEVKRLKAWVKPLGELGGRLRDLKELEELVREEQDAEVGREIARDLETADREIARLELRALLSDPNDSKDAYLCLHAGAGGTESCDWAEMLLRMYQRWCDRQGYTVTLIDYGAGEEAGIRRVTLRVEGEMTYGYLKGERGVHRLVRISPFDANQRRHTSFASVDVYPRLDEAAPVDISEKDIRVDTYRAGGKGGQHVNVTDSAVRITHVPTGAVVQCQNERSQHQNRRVALEMLKAKLLQLEESKREEARAQEYGAKGEIAWGNQIRSYVLHPYQMVKDHRTEAETSSAQQVLDGDLELFTQSYLRWKLAQRK